MSSVLDNALIKAGIPLPPKEITASRYTRWGKKKEYYAIQLSDGSGYFYGDFRQQDGGHAVFEKGQKPNKQLIKKAKEQFYIMLASAQEKVSKACSEYWTTMLSVSEHPYLKAKQVKSHGLRCYLNKIVIPVTDIDGKIWSFQYIAPNGDKHFKSGGRKNGCFYVIGDIKDSQQLFICEGYATGATIYECTEIPTIVAFDAGNLFPVTKTIRDKYPLLQLVICADNDAYGEVNTGLVKAQKAAKYFNVEVVFPTFKDTSTKPTDFNDLFILEGMDEVKRQILQPQEKFEEQSIDGFQNNETALSYYDEKRKSYIKISAPLKVVALTRELDEENAGRLLEFKDRQGKTKQVKIFDSWLSKDGSKIHDVLYKHGLDIGTDGKTKRKLNEFLNLINPTQVITYTVRSGWHGRSFLTATQAYGQSDESLIHMPAAEPAKLNVSGTLEEWQANIAELCKGNSRLMLAVSASFASMILNLCQADNFFLHFYGRSSQGKTTMLDVAASVFGDHSYTRTWRMTDNGLEGIAMAHNDLCLFLDEISECDPYKIGAMAYMLVNGLGKTRATSQGLARKVMRWTLGGISTGEEQLADIIKATGKNPKAGQLLRILSIPALPEGGFGLFEDIHKFSSSADFAMHLKETSQKYHGTAFQAFVRAAIADYDNIKNFYNQEKEKAKQRSLPASATGQDIRVFNTFATCGIGGLLATKYNVLNWHDLDIMELVMKNFFSWLESKGGVGSQEDKQALNQIRVFFEKYGDSRFQFMDDGQPSTERLPYERAGYRTYRRGEPLFFVFKTYFEEIIAKGLDIKHVKNLLRDQEILETEKDQKHFAKLIRIASKPVRMYVINNKILEGENNE